MYSANYPFGNAAPPFNNATPQQQQQQQPGMQPGQQMMYNQQQQPQQPQQQFPGMAPQQGFPGGNPQMMQAAHAGMMQNPGMPNMAANGQSESTLALVKHRLRHTRMYCHESCLANMFDVQCPATPSSSLAHLMAKSFPPRPVLKTSRRTIT